ncbi:hypothetical protein TVAG_426190 [Trichomonas vaginalis G3]|uniref:Uncharacterized protein n=1 Tax=Trichomonas vaginalis (strain ATCC PRA-98 / G3) TaxID=412133 RepID=A2DYN6_TRIV3|nr:hypothetical protein TVAGG3_0850770 [Trichomonas vaginalis G3]EAY14426.1 hypothetical protein TVAG_426190 [Trichomonas vaginalis G3]KAI5499968.1 hypothetical protein TVAGG3_0850770 [Trichomonas vaginalis G3]|eukprot:XP_001326649.1 hypothetical protein [Trichomonas vaginalis G3]
MADIPGNEKTAEPETELSDADIAKLASDLKISQLTHENQELSTKLKEMSQEKDKIQEELNKLREEKNEDISLENIEGSLKVLTDENARLNKEITSLKSSLSTFKETTEANQKTTEQYNNLNKQYLNLKEDHRSLTIANNEQEMQFVQIKDELAKANEKIKQNSVVIDALNGQLSITKKELQDITDENKNLQQKISELQIKNNNYELKISQLQIKEKELSESEKRYFYLNNSNQRLNEEYTKLKFQYEIKVKEIISTTNLYQEKLSEKEQIIHQLNDKLYEINTLQRAQSRSFDSNSVVVNYTKTKNLERSCKTLSNQVDNLKKQNTRLKAKLNSSDSLKKQVLIKEHENAQLQEEYSRFKNTAYKDIARLQENTRIERNQYEQKIQALTSPRK